MFLICQTGSGEGSELCRRATLSDAIGAAKRESLRSGETVKIWDNANSRTIGYAIGGEFDFSEDRPAF